MKKLTMLTALLLAVILGSGSTFAPVTALSLYDYKTVDGGFVDGYLWVTGKSGFSDEYYACMDLNGQLTTAFPKKGWLYPSGNGYAYIKSSDTWTVIDAAGNVHSSYETDNDHRVTAYGDGYTLILVSPVGFNASSYSYVLYGPEGDVIIEAPLEDKPRYNSKYYGNGVFLIDRELWYFVESGVLETISYDKLSVDFSGSDSWAFAYKTTSFGRVLEITCFDTSGSLKVFVPEDDWIYASEYSGPFFCANDDTQGKRYFYVDAENCALREMDSDYAYRSRNMYPWGRSDSFVALPMKGDDGYHYISMFDDQWNILMDPVRVDFNMGARYRFTDGILLVWNDDTVHAYDEQGQEVFTLTEEQCGYMSGAKYSGGVLILNDNTVIDKTGSTLFSFHQIDTSHAVVIEELP